MDGISRLMQFHPEVLFGNKKDIRVCVRMEGTPIRKWSYAAKLMLWYELNKHGRNKS